MTKEKIELEYDIRSAPGILYNRLVTPGGLAEWFADNVKINDHIYTFVWEGSEEEAEMLQSIEGESVRFKWVDDDEEESYFEFKIKIDSLTGDIALIVTDFAEPDEVNETTNLWDKQIGKLKLILGS
ncbi:SRPBCC domain-containing protein [bacterium SCSIO 12741]|nr:SRPBCC domain-containing protein [bacterium SCSIO 12741]